VAQSATHHVPWFPPARHRLRSDRRTVRRPAPLRRLAIGTAFVLLAVAGTLCTISLVRLQEPLMAISAVTIPVCLVAASFALSIADRTGRRD
jgi:hypothetical protein